MKTIQDVPGLQTTLDECQEKVQQLLGFPVTVRFDIKFHRLTVSSLLDIIIDECKVSWAMIMTENRKSELIIARQLICHFLHTAKLMTHAETGNLLRYYDHSQSIRNCLIVQKMIDTADEKYMPLIMAIEKRITKILSAA